MKFLWLVLLVLTVLATDVLAKPSRHRRNKRGCGRYNRQFYVCCNGVRRWKGTATYCCGTRNYDRNFYVCCAGVLKWAGNGRYCCGTRNYNRNFYVCCPRNIVRWKSIGCRGRG